MTFSKNQQKTLRSYVSKLKTGCWERFFYYCCPIRKKVVLSNMQLAFSSVLTDEEIIRLAKAFYGHMGRFLFENIQMRFLSSDKIKSKVRVEGYEHLLKIRDEGCGIALLAGHFGNWEMGAIGGMLNFQDFRDHFYVIRKTLNIKWVENILFRRFARAGVRVLPKQNALARAVDLLEEKNAVVFIMDQYANLAARDGIKVPFFGRETGTYKSLGMIAQHTDCAVVPMSCYRETSGKHVLVFFEPINQLIGKTDKESLCLNTEVYNKKLEEIILMRPEQWLWFHKRWKDA